MKTTKEQREKLRKINIQIAEVTYGLLDDIDTLETQLKVAVGALEGIEPNLRQLAETLFKANGANEQQRIAEHDACLIACGFLDTKKILAEIARIGAGTKGEV